MQSSRKLTQSSAKEVQSAEAEWWEITTPRFVIRAHLPPERLDNMVQELEETRAAVLGMAWPNAASPPERISVVVLANQEETRRFLPPNVPSRVILMAPYSDLVVLNSDSHGVTHELTSWFMPLQPLWLSEGLASFLENVSFDRKTQRATMGLIPTWCRDILSRQKLVTSARLFEANVAHPSDLGPEQDVFYASAWLLVHYLLNEREESFARFQARLGKLEDWKEVWAVEFPDLVPHRLDEVLQGYARSHRFAVVTAPIAPPTVTSVRRRLSAAEIHGLSARLLLARYALYDAAEREAREALRLDPTELEALSIFFYFEEGRSLAQKSADAHRAINAHPTSGFAYLMLADTETTGSAGRLAAIERAWSLDPYQPTILAKLAMELIVSKREPERALTLMRLANRVGGLRLEYVVGLVTALGNAGRCESARRLAQNRVPRMNEYELEAIRTAWLTVEESCVEHANGTDGRAQRGRTKR